MKENLYRYFMVNTGALTTEEIILNFFAAVVIGVVIYISYRFSHSGTVYSARFNVSLVMITLVTTLVMSVIGNNIALSLGMVGALSIVRFRTAIKDPRDAVYIFWCIAVGICCGVSDFIVAGIGSAILFLFLLVFGRLQTNDRYLLVIRGKRKAEGEIEKIVVTYYNGKGQIRVKNTTTETIEIIYELSQKMLQQGKTHKRSITNMLYDSGDIDYVNLVCQNDEINR